jgi:hypothetical protein
MRPSRRLSSLPTRSTAAMPQGSPILRIAEVRVPRGGFLGQPVELSPRTGPKNAAPSARWLAA